MLRFALPLLLAATPAVAGWQGAEWGMSRDEVLGAVILEPAAENGDFLLFRGEVAGVALMFSFRFSGDELTRIFTKPKDPGRCGDILSALEKTYGRPENRDARATRWRDEVNGNLVKMGTTIVSGSVVACDLSYEPIPVAGSGGF